MSTATKTAKKEFTMEQAFALWRAKSAKGAAYFTGKYDGSFIRGFYNTKKQNPKEPDIRIYRIDAEGNMEKDEFLSLWCNVSEGGKKYLTGKLDGRRVVGFINSKANDENKMPYVTVYWSDDQQQGETPAKQSEAPAKKNETPAKKGGSKKEETKEVETDDDLPF